VRFYEEIVERVRAIEAESRLFDFEGETLIRFLPFEFAKPFLIDEATEESFGERPPLTHESVVEAMREYMPHAWEKCEDERGLSAMRSSQRYAGWLWLLCDDDLSEMEPGWYGFDLLWAVCQKYGIEPTEWAKKKFAEAPR